MVQKQAGPRPRPKQPAKKAKAPFNYTEARRAASVANSQKSTGPRTELGKSVSKYNGAKEGFTSKPGFLHPDDDPQEVQNTIDLWATQLGAVTAPELAQVKTAVHANLTANRTWESQEAASVRTGHRIREGFDDRSAASVQSCVERLPADPAGALRELRTSTCGIFYLIGEWRLLGDWLTQFTSFEPSQRVRAIHLCGRRPCDLFKDTVVMDWDREVIGAVHGNGTLEASHVARILKNDRLAEITEDEFERLLKPMLPTLPSIKEGHETLQELVAGVIEELIERHELISLREERDLALELKEKKTVVTKDGMNLNRYRRDNERAEATAHKTLRELQLMRLKYGEALGIVVEAAAAEEAEVETRSEPKDEPVVEIRSEPKAEPVVEIRSEPKATQVAGGAEVGETVPHNPHITPGGSVVDKDDDRRPIRAFTTRIDDTVAGRVGGHLARNHPYPVEGGGMSGVVASLE